MYTEILKPLNISRNDVLFVSSDVMRFVMSFHRKKLKFAPDLFIDALMHAVGANGTLIFPTYNWGFCSGQPFDYRNTLSQVGSLTNTVLKRTDFKRTRHPIYSFAVWGKDTDRLCALENKSSFGPDSPFAYFYQVDAKNLFIDVDYQHSATFVHYLEEKVGVPYRYLKDFSAQYIDENAVASMRTYSMFVRYLDKDVEVTINPMHEVFLKHGAVNDVFINDVLFRMLDMKKAYDLVEQDIRHNNSRNITSYKGQEK